jgi:hypothetical protein
MSRALRRIERDLYLASRTVGDLNAAQRGPDVLAKRIIRRAVRRNLFRLLGR